MPAELKMRGTLRPSDGPEMMFKQNKLADLTGPFKRKTRLACFQTAPVYPDPALIILFGLCANQISFWKEIHTAQPPHSPLLLCLFCATITTKEMQPCSTCFKD